MGLDIFELVVHDGLDICWRCYVLTEQGWVFLESFLLNLPYNGTAFGDVLFEFAAGLGSYQYADVRYLGSVLTC